jgi:hypothetical protein
VESPQISFPFQVWTIAGVEIAGLGGGASDGVIMRDGVYLNLPFEVYIKSTGEDGVTRRMGSTDWTKLYTRGRGWWWTSPYNRYHRETTTAALVFGTALHAIQFEGRAAYEERFAVEPNPNDYPDLLTTATELQSALRAVGAPGLKAKMAKNDLVQLGRAYLEGRHIWDDIVERWSRTVKGRTPISAAEHFAIEAMHNSSMADPAARILFGADEEVRLSEVSILYTPADGIPRRYRMDGFLPTANVDLKSFANWRAEGDVRLTLGDLIAKDNLDIQLAMSHEARLAAYRMITEGRVVHWDGLMPNNAMSHLEQLVDRPAVKWVKRFPREAPLNAGSEPGWCFAWVFFQKPEGGAAPELIPVRVGYGDDVHRNGVRKYAKAVATFRENVARFGLTKPWTGISEIFDTNPRYARRIQLPPWSEVPDRVPGEEEALNWRT